VCSSDLGGQFGGRDLLPGTLVPIMVVLGAVAKRMDDPKSIDGLKARMLEEITKLEHELRNELPKEILKARAHGDLRENAEFHAAKDRQRYVDARLSKLQLRLSELSLVDMSKIPRDRVGLGSRVVVFDVKKNEEITYKLVASEESDVANGLISTSSPIGKGLLGKKVGDDVTINIPGGQRTLELLELKTVHDVDDVE
jgi:transcription elongation factor GreA